MFKKKGEVLPQKPHMKQSQLVMTAAHDHSWISCLSAFTTVCAVFSSGVVIDTNIFYEPLGSLLSIRYLMYPEPTCKSLLTVHLLT